MEQDKLPLMNDEKLKFVNEIRNYLGIAKIKRMFSLGTEIFTAATPFLDNPTWWNAGKVAFALGKVLIEDVEVWAEDYFSGDEWVMPYSNDFNQTLLNVLQKFPFERIKTTDQHTFVRVCTLPNGIKAGWTYSGQHQHVDNIYVETAHLQEAKDYIKQLLWHQYKGKSLVMRKNRRMSGMGSNSDERVIFEIDDTFESKLSKRAIDLSKQLVRPLNEGISRSIMFYGPPGTGKSTLARTIVELMKLRSFRIRIGDLDGLDSSTLFEAVNVFEPDAVILDDFDRAHGQAQLLETLEFFQQKVKLVITTVNNCEELDDALLRPGRIDILELVDRMDEEVVKHVLGPYNDGYELVKDWPVAFISEYVKRRSYMSVEEAAESVKELALRVDKLKGYNDEDKNDEVGVMLKILKKVVSAPEAEESEDDHPLDTSR